ncbi:MAG: hypothetical protein GY774_29290 [Planctomycetes bacterium]|nr:hypothetical protein [Planctomycetota bacterium]
MEDSSKDFSLYRICQLYLSKLPASADISKALWFTALRRYKEDEHWYKSQPVGVNKLGTFVKYLMSELGFPGRYTNHSLRATTVSVLADEGFKMQISWLAMGTGALNQFRNTVGANPIFPDSRF